MLTPQYIHIAEKLLQIKFSVQSFLTFKQHRQSTKHWWVVIWLVQLLFSRRQWACDWSGRHNYQHQSSRCRCRFCWDKTLHTCYTKNHRHRQQHSSYASCRSHCLKCWTSSRWRSNMHVVRTSSHLRRLRCTRRPSAGTYQPHHWWRTSSIQPSTIDCQYDKSAIPQHTQTRNVHNSKVQY